MRVLPVLLVVLLIASGGLVALQARQPSFEVPPHAVGDRGLYEIVDDDGVRTLAFEWLPPSWVPAADGSQVWADTIRLWREEGWDLSFPLQVDLHLEPVTRRPLSATIVYEAQGAADSGLLWSRWSGALQLQETTWSYPEFQAFMMLPCAVVDPIQGAAGRFCMDGLAGRVESHIVRTGTTDNDTEAATFLTRQRDVEMEASFIEDMPYPYHAAIRSEDETERTYTMLGYERGNGALARPRAAAQGHSLPDLVAPALHGPPGSLGLGFEAEDAYRHLQRDEAGSRWRAWMDDHPEARLVALDSEALELPMERRQTWMFTWSDHGAALRTEVVLRQQGPDGLLPPDVWIAYHDEAPHPDGQAAMRNVAHVKGWLQHNGHGATGITGWGFGDGSSLSFAAGPVMWLERDVEAQGVDVQRVGLAIDGDHEYWLLDAKGLVAHGAVAQQIILHATPIDPLPRNHASPETVTTLPESPPWLPLATFGATLGIVLAWLLKNPLAALFSRHHPDRLLDHPLRRKIHALVHDQPGIHYKALGRAIGGGHGTLEHHLSKLVDAGLIDCQRAQGYTCYFPGGTPAAARRAASATKSRGAQALAAAIQSHPGCTLSELAEEAGISVQNASYHVRRLCEAGTVEARREAGRLRLWPCGTSPRPAALP